MDDFDLEELPRKKYEEEISDFFPLNEQQTESFEWGHNTVAIPSRRPPTSVPSSFLG